MSTDDRKDLPPASAHNFLEKVREALSTYLGTRGDKLDRGVTLRDITEAGIAELRPGYLSRGGKAPISGVGTGVEPVYEVDLTPPPTPTGFTVSAAISNIFIECASPIYTQGHGHAKTKVYGATWVSGPLPVFADAVVITEFQGTTFAHATNPATTWHLWIKWVSVDGVESTTPAGGINGLSVTTGQDVSTLLTALTGELTESQLSTTLGTRIDLIDGASSVAGSVNARILTEANERINAVNYEARTRNSQVQANAEALLRNVLAVDAAAAQASTNLAYAKSELTTDFQAGIAAEATARTTLDARLATEKTQTLALISDEATARATAVSAEATARGLLATQVLGADGTSLTQGLIYDERTTRSTETTSLAQQITLLSAGAGEQFDWQTIWYFDAGIESWSGNGTPTATSGWLRPADQVSGAYVNSPAGIAADGAKYGQVRLRIRKTGTPTFAGWLYWQGTLDSTWDNARRVALTEPTFDVNGIGLITVSPAWGSITLDKIRVDLSSAQTVTDYFEIDWVAVGRPSPGASSAQLTTEQTVRAAADTANANAITTLSAQVNNATNGLPATYAGLLAEQTARADADTAEASARVALAARVTTAEGNITATSSALTTEQTTRANDDTTNANAITALSSQVNDASTGLPKTRADLIDTQSTLATATAASVADIRSLRAQSAAISETALRNILTTDATRTDFTGTLALATQELRTDIQTGLSAEASARLALAAVVSSNASLAAAALSDEQTTRATADTAEANARLALATTVNNNYSTLTTNYYTGATVDSAIATASTTLRAYADAGDAVVDARVTTVETTKIGYCTIGGVASDHTTKSTCEAAGGTWSVGLPLAQAVKQVSVSDGTTTAALEQRFTAQKTLDDTFKLQYSVKLDVGDKVAGFGLYNDSSTGSSFAIRSDRFYISPPAVGAGSATTDIAPFIVQTTNTTASNGTPIPAGVYIDTAFIKNATIKSAQIQSVKADTIQTGILSAKISHTGDIYNGVNAYSFSTDPTTGVVTPTWLGYTPGTVNFGTGYYLGQLSGAPQFFVGSPTKHVLWDGSALTVRGTVYATAGELQGLTIKNAAGTVLLASGTAATDILNSYVTASGVGAVATDLSNAPSSIINSNVTYAGLPDSKPPTNADHTASNIAAGIAGQGYFATLNQITSGNISTYIAGAAIGSAYIANAAIQNAHIANAAINSAKIDDLAVTTVKIAGNAVTVPASAAASAVSGNGAWQLIASVVVGNDVTGATALVIFSAACSYAALKTTQYLIEWWANGSFVGAIFNSYPISGAYVPLASGSGAATSMATGTHTFQLWWYGEDGNVGITAGNLTAIGVKK